MKNLKLSTAFWLALGGSSVNGRLSEPRRSLSAIQLPVLSSDCVSIISMIGDTDGFGVFVPPGSDHDFDTKRHAPTDGFTDQVMTGDMTYEHLVDLSQLDASCTLTGGYLEVMTGGQGFYGNTTVRVNGFAVGQLSDGEDPSGMDGDYARKDILQLTQDAINDIVNQGGTATVEVLTYHAEDEWIMDYSKLTLTYECSAGVTCPADYHTWCQNPYLFADFDCQEFFPTAEELYSDGAFSSISLTGEFQPGDVVDELGIYPYWIEAQYASGDFATLTCMGTVSLGDYIPPSLECSTDIPVFVTDPGTCSVPYVAPTPPVCTDNCDPSPVCYPYNHPTGGVGLGENYLPYFGEDESGNTGACSSRMHVVTETVDLPFPDRTDFPAPCLGLPRNRIHDGTDQQGWEIVPFCDGDCVHGTGEYAELELRFPFQLFGEEYTSVIVHQGGYLQFDDETFVHAYNSEVDMYNIHTSNMNHVWYSSGPNGFAVVWDHVTKENGDCNQHNTFQILITNGRNAAGLGAYNLCSCYDTMEWADGSGGLVGAESGEKGVDIQIGVFSDMSASYNGPHGQDDGVGFLENRAICYNVQSMTFPPIVIDFPEFPLGSDSIHLERCGSPGELQLQFYFIPGREGVGMYDVEIYGDIPQGMLLQKIPEDNYIFIYISWENISPVDPFELEFIGLDTGSPRLSTRKVLRVEVEDKCPEEVVPTPPPTPNPTPPPTPSPVQVEQIEEVSPTEPPEPQETPEPTPSPTPDDGVCMDKPGRTFYVDYENAYKNCIWLSGRDYDIEMLCHPGHAAYDICEDTCGKCVDCDDAPDTVLLPSVMVDPSQQLQYAGMTCSILADRPRDQPLVCAIPGVAALCRDTCLNCATPSPTTTPPLPIVPDTPPPVCDDELGTTFGVWGKQKDCVWLMPRVNSVIEHSSDFPNGSIPAGWLGRRWGERLCGTEESQGPAYAICRESCGACEDDCVDARVFTDENGAERTCAWLRTRGGQIPSYCNAAGSSAGVDCGETCGTCD